MKKLILFLSLNLAVCNCQAFSFNDSINSFPIINKLCTGVFSWFNNLNSSQWHFLFIISNLEFFFLMKGSEQEGGVSRVLDYKDVPTEVLEWIKSVFKKYKIDGFETFKYKIDDFEQDFRAYFYAPTHSIVFQQKVLKDLQEDLKKGESLANYEKILLHEICHSLQKSEDFIWKYEVKKILNFLNFIIFVKNGLYVFDSNNESLFLPQVISIFLKFWGGKILIKYILSYLQKVNQRNDEREANIFAYTKMKEDKASLEKIKIMYVKQSQLFNQIRLMLNLVI